MNNVNAINQAVAATTTCPSCHAVNRPGAKFCGACGARIEQPAAAGTETATPSQRDVPRPDVPQPAAQSVPLPNADASSQPAPQPDVAASEPAVAPIPMPTGAIPVPAPSHDVTAHTDDAEHGDATQGDATQGDDAESNTSDTPEPVPDTSAETGGEQAFPDDSGQSGAAASQPAFPAPPHDEPKQESPASETAFPQPSTDALPSLDAVAGTAPASAAPADTTLSDTAAPVASPAPVPEPTAFPATPAQPASVPFPAATPSAGATSATSAAPALPAFQSQAADEPEDDEPTAVFAEGLPDWDITPPNMPVRRKHRKKEALQ
ncbi:ribonuclease E [Bifidobacterium leontopitheci]|uniref:Ribonuclease E n=2 Tax=Bifidobacterium leontopitheci TaxID=2650774 RepID=A0A6I1GKV7_9BIFI|nr:ribonuclease E [Bifidobacterium leontopitheci]